MLNACILLALVPLCIIALANSQQLNKPDFISIDCGSVVDTLDKDAGILYSKDEGFVETGDNHIVDKSEDFNGLSFGTQLRTLRSFPNGNRNCYSLKPKQGKNKKYFIRAFFAYGNYDGKNQTQVFDLYLGVNKWETVTIPPPYYGYREIIHTPSTDTIDVCLVKIHSTIPFISSLELRLLNDSIYQNQGLISSSDPKPLLQPLFTVDVGYDSNIVFKRYESDPFDRMWRIDPNYNKSGWIPLALDTIADDGTRNDAYKVPPEVLFSTAAKSVSISSSLQYGLDDFGDLETNFDYYVYFHFAEIEKLPDGQKRIINITLNSNPILPHPLLLEYLKPVTVENVSAGSVSFTISATSESDAPPILNAFEICKVITNVISPTDQRDVAAIMDIKSDYQLYRFLNWQGDPCLPNDYLWEGVLCTNTANPRITSLNLSSKNLQGEITNAFSYLTQLQVLDLSHNELKGHLPEFLGQLPKLKLLNLTGNKLSGPIPKSLKEKEKGDFQLSVADNPDLCLEDSCKNKNFVVPIVASFSILIVILLIFLGFWIFRRQKAMRSDFKKKGDSMNSKNKKFSYTDILTITDNFKSIIGEGGFGKVYAGILQDDTQVAVKMLSSSSRQGHKEFRSEAQLLMIVHHRNLVSLIGYCDEGETKALIYEYMANGNLRQHLSVKNPNILSWKERINIAVDAAHGLEYLHNGCKPPIIHRDLKTSNILLDQEKHAKIADFGLSRAFGNDIDSHISTCPAGTPGYIDPEFQKTGSSNKKSDVYSFGIILFELITGQQAVTVRDFGERIHILQSVIPIIEGGDVKSVVDPRLHEDFSINSAWKVVEIALSCISPTAPERPDMSQVLAELNECLSLEMVQANSERVSIPLPLTYFETESDIAPIAR